MRLPAVARERRHTLYLLEHVRGFAPVFLDTEVDMTRVREHRAAARGRGTRYSVVSYVLQSAGRTLARHPEANAAVRGRSRPRVARYGPADGKVTLDKTLAGRRVVLSTVVPDVHEADLDAIQARLDRYRDADADTMPEFARVRALQRLPMGLGRLVLRATVRPRARRRAALGTFSVTSLGHRPVDGFHSVGGTTITLGVGRIQDRAAVRGGAVVVAPLLRLSLSFDHRVIDGAEAADVLAEIKEALESYPDGIAHGAPDSTASDAATSDTATSDAAAPDTAASDPFDGVPGLDPLAGLDRDPERPVAGSQVAQQPF